MKMKLFGWLFLLVLGAGSPKLLDGVSAWWNAPPTPLREEAKRLIASLESAERCTARVGGSTGHTVIDFGGVYVRLNTWHADVLLNGVDANDSFTAAERRAIQRAGESCLRKLTARGLDTATAATK